MSDILTQLGINPNPQTHEEYAAAWAEVAAKAKALSAIEMDMRKKLFAATFPNPVEGVNTHLLPNGKKLKGTYRITRSLDEEAIEATRAEYMLLNDRPLEFDELIKVKRELATAGFRKIEPKAGQDPSPAYQVVSRMLTSKPGAPTLTLE